MSFIPKPQEIYKHFKGNLYQITAIAEHSETGEQLVIYQALYGEFKTYARPLAMFVGRVDREKYPDAEQEFRFELQGADAERQRAESASEPDAPMQKPAPEPDAPVRRTVPGADEAVQRTAQDSVWESKRDTGGKEESAFGWDAGGEAVQEDPVQEDPEEVTLDPFVLEFLDSDSYEQRLNILAGLHHRITNEMITTMAIACDIEIDEGDVEERYASLRTCLLTLERYECNRLR